MSFSTPVEYQVVIHDEDGSLWAEVVNLPGCFASGDNQEELEENLAEAIGLYLSSETSQVRMQHVATEVEAGASVQKQTLQHC